jgi:predicted O-methyltransferase YrrM
MRAWEEMDERFERFMQKYESPLPAWLQKIERQAEEDEVPIIRRSTQRYLAFLLGIIRPRRILEIGSAVGFSALLMANFDPSLEELVTIENYEPRIVQAKENFSNSPFSDKITFLTGDASKLISTLEGRFDLVFIDAAKGQYPEYLKLVRPLMTSGGVILADNILQDGFLLMPKEALCRRNRTIHKRVREYLDMVCRDDQYITDVLPVGDGLAMTRIL